MHGVLAESPAVQIAGRGPHLRSLKAAKVLWPNCIALSLLLRGAFSAGFPAMLFICTLAWVFCMSVKGARRAAGTPCESAMLCFRLQHLQHHKAHRTSISAEAGNNDRFYHAYFRHRARGPAGRSSVQSPHRLRPLQVHTTRWEPNYAENMFRGKTHTKKPVEKSVHLPLNALPASRLTTTVSGHSPEGRHHSCEL